jgi:hypothetical protein
MRMVLIVAGVAMMSGCSSFGRPNDPPHPPREAARRAPPREPRVERWTDRQRDCEVGDRKKQRRCIMRYPDE